VTESLLESHWPDCHWCTAQAKSADVDDVPSNKTIVEDGPSPADPQEYFGNGVKSSTQVKRRRFARHRRKMLKVKRRHRVKRRAAVATVGSKTTTTGKGESTIFQATNTKALKRESATSQMAISNTKVPKATASKCTPSPTTSMPPSASKFSFST